MSHEQRWEEKLIELEEFFKVTPLTSGEMKLNDWTTIMDVPRFVNTHLAMARSNFGNKHFAVYVQRLVQLKEILEHESKPQT